VSISSVSGITHAGSGVVYAACTGKLMYNYIISLWLKRDRLQAILKDVDERDSTCCFLQLQSISLPNILLVSGQKTI